MLPKEKVSKRAALMESESVSDAQIVPTSSRFGVEEAANAGSPSMVRAAGEKPDFQLPGKFNFLEVEEQEFEAFVGGIKAWDQIYTTQSASFGPPVQAFLASKSKAGKALQVMEFELDAALSQVSKDDTRETDTFWDYDSDQGAIIEVEYYLDGKELPQGIKFLTSSQQEEIQQGAPLFTLTEEAKSLLPKIKHINAIYAKKMQQNVFDNRREAGFQQLPDAGGSFNKQESANLGQYQTVVAGTPETQSQASNTVQNTEEDPAVVAARQKWLSGPVKI